MNNKIKWYDDLGNESDVVCSSRICLARNLVDYPFPAWLSTTKTQEINEKILNLLSRSNSTLLRELNLICLEDLTDNELVSLVERHIVSPEFISNFHGKVLLVSKDESISVMINEEDHIRIQVIKAGLSVIEAAEIASKTESRICEGLTIAFDSRLGYLTQCISNVGTGMRASLMLHLPALTERGIMQRLSDNLSKLGLVIRGSYGEGSVVIGDKYQISNQITLGISEEEAVNNLNAIAFQIIEEERKARREISENIILQDRIVRAAGTLKNAKILSVNEFSKHISSIRLGVSLNLISGISHEEIDKLSIFAKPATLEILTQADSSKQQTDILRAEIVRKQLNKISIAE